MQHHIEIDQSVKVEQTGQATALSFSDGVHGIVLLPAEVKRACQQELRRQGVKPGMIAIRLFAAGILLLLEGQMHRIASLTIDTEYEGWEGEIKGLLLRFIRRWVPGFPTEAINFRQIGRKSAAHALAWETHRGERKPDKVATFEELLEYC
ncbi:MAG: hypothetical protein AMXMBFR16_11720 [Candidatus Uhrbacteria bacterium]